VDSRRTALIKIATAATSAAFAPLLAEVPGAEHHAHELMEQAPMALATGPEYFNKSDYETISKLVDLIIPRTDTPGAVDAGVPHRIDVQVAAKPELQEPFKKGLAELAEKNFSALPEPQQVAILQAMSGDAFFKTVKDLTVDAYYASEAGLVQELGFKGNTFRASFPGCTHPEHWATEEHAQ
jgi:hypothetical protein